MTQRQLSLSASALRANYVVQRHTRKLAVDKQMCLQELGLRRSDVFVRGISEIRNAVLIRAANSGFAKKKTQLDLIV